MIKTVIIEDDKSASNFIIKSLLEVSPEVNVIAVLPSIRESILYLKENADVDLIFSDVQLSDGLSFEIFKKSGSNIPVIFITAYDQFMISAFDSNGIDYLLKPFRNEDLKNALQKFINLRKHFEGNGNLDKLLDFINKRKKTRLIVRKGQENISLVFTEIVLFYTENKLVFAVDKEGKKYLVDKNLSDMEHELDPDQFFRVNRQFILNSNYIRGFKPVQRVKLKVDLTVPFFNYIIIVSQETAPEFRKWINRI